MLHVGWASASATVTSASSLAPAAAERAARRGDDEPGDGPGGGAPEALGERRVLAVDRQQPAPLARGGGQHELAAGDQALLVRERQVGAGGERRERRAQPGGAHDRVQHDVGARWPRPAAPRRRRPRARLAVELARAAVGGGGVDERDVPHARARGRRRPGRRGRGGPRARTTSSSGLRAMTSSACTPIEPVAPRTATDLIGQCRWGRLGRRYASAEMSVGRSRRRSIGARASRGRRRRRRRSPGPPRGRRRGRRDTRARGTGAHRRPRACRPNHAGSFSASSGMARAHGGDGPLPSAPRPSGARRAETAAGVTRPNVARSWREL